MEVSQETFKAVLTLKSIGISRLIDIKTAIPKVSHRYRTLEKSVARYRTSGQIVALFRLHWNDSNLPATYVYKK